MLKQVVSSAVDGFLSHHVSSGLRQRLDGQRNRRGTGRHRQCGHAALERRDALLENGLRGVGKASVDITRVRQAESIRRMLRVLKHIASGLIDWDRTRIRCRIRLLLAHVQLQGVEMECVVWIVRVLAHGLPP